MEVPDGSRPVVISLCDLSGNMAAPWVSDGYDAVLVDPKHGTDSVDGRVFKYARTILEAMPALSEILKKCEIALVAGFPPCTDVAVSGARWFSEKASKDLWFQHKAALVAEQCRAVGMLSGAPWFFENPKSVFSSIFGKPQHIFQPWHYTAYEQEDNYKKLTCLWSGGGFVLPNRNVDPSLGPPDNRIHMMGESRLREERRSYTPMGFARAVYYQHRLQWRDTI